MNRSSTSGSGASRRTPSSGRPPRVPQHPHRDDSPKGRGSGGASYDDTASESGGAGSKSNKRTPHQSRPSSPFSFSEMSTSPPGGGGLDGLLGGQPTHGSLLDSRRANGGGGAAGEPPPPPQRAGPFVRYVVVPLLLLPVAWPWVGLRLTYMLASSATMTAGGAVDLLILVAELLRRQRSNIDTIAGWLLGCLYWVLGYYWSGLTTLHQAGEEGIYQLGQVVAPLLAPLLRRYPLLGRCVAPFASLSEWVQGSVMRAYFFVHDEIVPVALDLAERLPLVHGLLHRAMAQQ